MKKIKMRGMLALLLAGMMLVSLAPSVGLAATPSVKDIKLYLTADTLATFSSLGEIDILGIQVATVEGTETTIPGKSYWVSTSSVPRFGSRYQARFDPNDSATYSSAYFYVTIAEMAGYASSDAPTVGSGNALGPQHRAKVATTIYNAPGGKSIGTLAAGKQVQIMYIVSGLACLVEGGYVDFSALELIRGEKR